MGSVRDTLATSADERRWPRRFVALLLALGLNGCAPRSAIAPGFNVMETYSISPDETQAIVTLDGAHRRLRALTIMVSGRALWVENISVRYTNDDVIEYSVGDRIEPGNTTRAFELPGNYRSVRAVEVRYRVDATFSRGLVRLHVYGRR